MFALLLGLGAALAADMDPWFLAGSKPDNYTMELDESVLHSGANSARLASTKDRSVGFGTMMQNFSPEKYRGQRVQLSAWIRSEEVKGWAGLWMRVDGPVSGESLAFDNMSNRAIEGSTEWTRYTVVLDVPEEATNIALGVLLNGGGVVWIDDLEFEVVPRSVPSTNHLRTEPTNLGFEDRALSPPSLKSRALAGDDAAWNELVSRHDRRVWVSLLALGVHPERARELAQETWTLLWQRAGEGGLQHLELPGLALRQARFLALSELRRSSTRAGAALPPRSSPFLDPSIRAHSRAQLLAIHRALRGHRDGRLFELVYGQGLSHAEAACELDLSVQRTRQRLCELRAWLRELPELKENEP